MRIGINILTKWDEKEKEIVYEEYGDVINVVWKETTFELDKSSIDNIINKFFLEKEKWYCLGASMTKPIKDGLGEFIQVNLAKSPRYASLIAAILYDKGIIEFKGKRKIYIRKI